MINRPLLFQRWSGQTFAPRTLLNESLKKIASIVAKGNTKRYCLSLVGTLRGTITPGGEAADISQDEMLAALGSVSLTHHGGHLVDTIPLRDIAISNLVEGYLPPEKTDLIIPADGFEVANGEQDFEHTFILAYADRFHSIGSCDALTRVMGAKPMSLMSGDSDFRFQCGQLPDDWTCNNLSLNTMLWVHESAGELVDRPTRIVRTVDLRDPIPFPAAFKKPAFAALITDPGETIAFAGSDSIHPRYETDGYNELEGLSIFESEIMRRTVRADGNRVGANGQAYGNELLGNAAFLLIDPFQAQKMTNLGYGHDLNIWGELQAAQQAAGAGKLTLLTRLYEPGTAANFATQMSRDNISMKARKAVNINGQPGEQHKLTRGEGLGIQPAIGTRAENRRPTGAA